MYTRLSLFHRMNMMRLLLKQINHVVILTETAMVQERAKAMEIEMEKEKAMVKAMEIEKEIVTEAEEDIKVI